MNWTVDYGDGPRTCTVPHAWRQDVDVRWEGPAVYRTEVDVDRSDLWLVFQGVSYQARVFLDDVLVCEHSGIWDAFAVPLSREQIADAAREYARPPGLESVRVRVEVVKNGGSSFPVKDVLSGFLPYVFHTFGGIFREVEVVESPVNPVEPYLIRETDERGSGLPLSPLGERGQGGEGPPTPRISIEGTKLFTDGKPWFMRGVLSWGWYPDIGSPHPPIEVIREEVRRVKALGFNLVKFCLWLPPHIYFQVLEEEGMWAWVELPLWMPSASMDLEAAFAEVERIVRQYRHHDRIVCWTCGCELSESTPHDFRKRLFEMVTDLTGCPLVKDNSGGSEMYGGDLREYGTFYDFHPYCDTMFYPPVLESLMIGPRKKMPVLLGEFNDYDVYRPIDRWVGEEKLEVDPERPWIIRGYKAKRPYWTSLLPELNDQGVRWQHDLPGLLNDKKHCQSKKVEARLAENSRIRSSWIREFVSKSVASFEDIAGYVVTGIADTPISTSGLASMSDKDRFWFGGEIKRDHVFRVPYRQPPWIRGGNRPGWGDVCCHFAGPTSLRLGARFEGGFHGLIKAFWRTDETEHEVDFELNLEPNTPSEIGVLTLDVPLGYTTLWTNLDEVSWLFCLLGFRPMDWKGRFDWSVHDAGNLLGGNREGTRPGTLRVGPPEGIEAQVAFLAEMGTLGMPFWRECAIDFSRPNRFFESLDRLFPVSTDRVIDPVWLESQLPGAEWLLTRVDTRTYKRHPYIARKGNVVVTTLRPWGGLGAQPYGLENNPAGCELLRILMKLTGP